MTKRSFYIDCTDIIQTDLNTGIQRVARNIINNRFAAQRQYGISCHPVYYDRQYGFIKVPGCHRDDLKNSIGYLHSVHSCISQIWRFKRLTKAIYPFPQFHNWLELHWKGTARWVLMWPLFIAVAPVVVASLMYTLFNSPRNCWKPGENDILIIPGLSWCNNNLHINKGINLVKANGGHLATIIHDLIAVSHPQYCADTYVTGFNTGLPYIISNTDLFIANSKTTKSILKQYISKVNPSQKIAITYFPLGADLDLINQTSDIRKNIHSLFAANKPYLCVGTIEPRKNYTFLLDAFDMIWKSNPNVHLCIVGRYGWQSEKLLERLKTHPLLGKNLTWFSDLDDTELVYCYKNAKALLFPSIIEGFGLPLIEALHYGCPVMASDIPVFREIGSDRCAYFSIDTTDDLVSKVNEFETCGKLPDVNQNDDFKWINWQESSLGFYKIIKEHFEKYEDSLTN